LSAIIDKHMQLNITPDCDLSATTDKHMLINITSLQAFTWLTYFSEIIQASFAIGLPNKSTCRIIVRGVYGLEATNYQVYKCYKLKHVIHYPCTANSMTDYTVVFLVSYTW